ncbi:MAG: MotA/TolQ/ExbB proton channel family protein [Desulfohalobiaceae bacterium]|nr:MotA/TolQ/ExbB proton channel family protein [Desulfohalobiaceae bacterium]
MELSAQSDILSMIFGATAVVKVVLAILVIMSLISWTLIFYKFFLYFKVKKSIDNDLASFSASKDLGSALRTLKNRPGSRLYVIGARAVSEIRSLERSNLPATGKIKVSADNIRRVLRRSVSNEVNKLAYALSFLATCTNSAPFIGLFGTVWGIMDAFQAIGIQQSAALTTVAPGIAEALVATAVGLFVAIPASIAYNSFLGMLNSIESEFVNYAGEFLNRAQREIPWLSAGREKEEHPTRIAQETI